jgi:hypothetical protein
MIKAQGRFTTFFRFACGFAAAMITGALIGALAGEALGVAVAVTICYGTFCPLAVYLGARPGGGTWREVVGLHAKPLAISAVAVGIAMALCAAVPAGVKGDLVRIGLGSVITAAVYVPLSWQLSPLEWREIVVRVKGFTGRAQD